MQEHFNRHRVPTLLLSAVLVFGTLGIVHNVNTMYELLEDSLPHDGFTVALVPELRELRPQPAQAGGFAETFNQIATLWYETICSVIRICNN